MSLETSPDAVSVRELRREFSVRGAAPRVAVAGISFSVRPGEVYGLLGANGAGKSTTMRMLATLTKPTSGTAAVNGHDVIGSPAQVRASLGYLSASSGLPTRVSCREVLTLFAGLHRMDDPKSAVEKAIQTYGVSEFAEQRIESLSTGMRQRVRIAAASIHEPPVLILDEPTAGLDIVAADRLLDAIEESRERGAAVIFSTHVLREAEKICDRIGIIDGGVLRAEGSVAELKGAEGVETFEDAFLAVVRS